MAALVNMGDWVSWIQNGNSYQGKVVRLKWSAPSGEVLAVVRTAEKDIDICTSKVLVLKRIKLNVQELQRLARSGRLIP